MKIISNKHSHKMYIVNSMFLVIKPYSTQETWLKRRWKKLKIASEMKHLWNWIRKFVLKVFWWKLKWIIYTVKFLGYFQLFRYIKLHKILQFLLELKKTEKPFQKHHVILISIISAYQSIKITMGYMSVSSKW